MAGLRPERGGCRGVLALLFLLAPHGFCEGEVPKGIGAKLPRRRLSLRQRASRQAALAPSTVNCTWVSVEQPLSHFSPGATAGGTFRQRLCVYDAFWGVSAAGAPIFFYTGNESPLDEYVNNTGFMWEAAPSFGALLVWAEHRYFGESLPVLEGKVNCLAWLSSQEALADYAALLETFRDDATWRWHAPRSPVIAFGGSYGGMLAAWFRMKYPSHVAGAIAASAPIWGFPYSVGDLDGSAVQLTNAALPVGGAPEACVPNLKAAWVFIKDLAGSAPGRGLVSEALGLCRPLEEEGDAGVLLNFLQGPLFNLAEGSYPFASDYITYATDNGTTAALPAWAVRKLCEPLAEDFGVLLTGDVRAVRFEVLAGSAVISVDWDQAHGNGYDVARDIRHTGVPRLLAAVAEGVQVWYNVTGTSTCLDWRSTPPSDVNKSASAMSLSQQGEGEGQPQGGAHHRQHADDEALISFWQERAESKRTRGGQGAAATGVCGKVDFSATLAWAALVCNDGMNLVNTAVHGFGRDLYWPPSHPKNVTLAEVVAGSMDYCKSYAKAHLYGLPEEPDAWGRWMDTAYGGRSISAHTNIFYSNGQLDPWTAGGVPPPGLTPAQPAALIELGGHHLDLFFAQEEDPPSVREVRALERELIARWIKEGRSEGRVIVESI